MINNLESIYQNLPEYTQLSTITYEGDFKIVNSLNQQFKYPTIGRNCLHPRSCFELEAILTELKTKGAVKCDFCNNQITQADLIKDIRYNVQKEFNEFVTNIMIISGKLLNKSQRKKRYLDFFSNAQIAALFKDLYERFVPKEASVNQLLIQELKQSTSKKTGINQRIQFWAFCLQDKVKITIPVRIIGCKHPECYELTSLLILQQQLQKQLQQSQQQQQQQQNDKFYQCVFPGCDNPKKKIDISTVGGLFYNIVIDLDLLDLIKKSNPNSMKFTFNYQTQRLEEDIIRENGKIIDPTIKSYYLKQKDIKQQFPEFQNLVLIQVAQICQNDLFREQKDLEKLLSCQKYRNFDVNMKDALTDTIIEQPVRCKNCTKFSACLDLKSYCCEYIKRKTIDPKMHFVCPLCEKPFNVSLASSSLSNYIYLDLNLLSRIFKDFSYRSTNLFKYQGRDYMIQEFYERQALTKKDYIDSLKSRKQPLNVNFKSIFCCLNKDQKLQIPLLLDYCPQKTVIDFSTFYQILEKCNFNLDQGLILCKCTECNKTPIKQISGNIYFHEAFDYALKKFNSNKSYQTSFSFDFENDRLTESKAFADSQVVNGINATKRGFIDMLNDEEYQNIFELKKLDGKHFQILSIQQEVCDGLEVRQNAQGYETNLLEKKNQMNQYAKQDQDLNKYNFQVKAIQVEFVSDLFTSNKGTIKE